MPTRRPAARRNPSWSKPTAYREDILDVLDEVFPEGAVLEVRGDSDSECLRSGKARVRKVVLDRFKEQGRDVDAMDLGRVLSSELYHYAGRDGRGAFVEIFRKRTAASRDDFAVLVGRNNPRRRPAARRNPETVLTETPGRREKPVTPPGVLIERAGGSLYAAKKGRTLHVITVDLPESARGSGHGIAMYEALFDYAKKNGLSVVSDSTVEAPAARVWEAMVRRGYPVVRHPSAVIASHTDGDFWYVKGGNVEVPVFSVALGNPRRRPAAKEPASRKEFDRRYWGKDYLREPEMFRQDLYEEWLASGMPFAHYKRACAARTLGDGAASDEVVVSRPKTPATFRRRNPAKIGAKALATALVRAMDAALDSGDLARMNAVHEIIEKEGMRSLDGLYRQIRHDPVDFILVAAPGFSTALKRATGKSRDEWARIIG